MSNPPELFSQTGLLPVYFDKVFRLLFDDTHDARILISFLNAILHLEGDNRIQSLTLVPREMQGDIPGDKEVILDIQAVDQKKRQLSVEMQVSWQGFYRARSLYYACGLFHRQLKEGQHYRELRPAYCIHLLCFDLWPREEVPQVHSIFTLRDHLDNRIYSDLLSLHVIELEKLPWNTLDLAALKGLDLEQVWLYLIRYGHMLTREVAQAVLPPEVQEAYGRLEMLSSEDTIRWVAFAMEKRKRDKAAYIPDLIEQCRQDGREIGLKEGRQEGRQEGARMAIAALERLLHLGRLTQEEFDAEKARIEAELPGTNSSSASS